MPSPFVAEIDLSLAKKIQYDLEEQGFALTKPPYTVFQAKKTGISCTLYKSGKLVVAGKNMQEFIEFYLEPHILQDFSYSHPKEIDKSPRIGSDEAGKGDVFGPLCVAAVYAGNEAIDELKGIGVRDSKKLSDQKVLEMGKKIEKRFPHHIVMVNPFKYNDLYEKFQNLNSLLAWAHATAIMKLVEKTKCTNIIVDQFAAKAVLERALELKKLELNLNQRHKAEEDLVVAAGAILARKTFLEGLQRLSKQFGLELPKGASSKVIMAGKKFVSTHGQKHLPEVAKMHFRSINSILD